jgi:hypothetical protein
MKIEIAGNRWRFSMAPDLTPEERGEAGHAVSLALIDPPRSKDELRRVAAQQAMNLYDGSKTARARELSRKYNKYLAGGWRREQSLDVLPETCSIERKLWHRLAMINKGAHLGWRRIFDISSMC